jgi:uncharacterized alkaline shock family protein YloU
MAVEQMGRFIARRSRGIEKVLVFDVKPVEEGIAITISVKAKGDKRNLLETGKDLREKILKAVSYFTGLEVKRIDVQIQEVEIP